MPAIAISVRHDFARFGRWLDQHAARQLPYAAVLALNATARSAAADITRELPAIFDRPTPFTKRAIGVQGARKTALQARVFVKPMQARYLGIEEAGGTRGAAPGAPLLVPVDQPPNAYGNIPRGLIRRLLARDPQRYFLARIRGVYGLWERTGGTGRRGGGPRGIRLLVAFRERATWRPRFGFTARVGATARARFLPALQAGLAKALATAR